MKTLELKKIRHIGGFAYVARTNLVALSSHKDLSTAIMLENGLPLSAVANVMLNEIRELGYGRHSFSFGNVYFSSSDNSDPNLNGRLYSIRYIENDLDRYGVILLPLLKVLYHPIMPRFMKNFLMDVGYNLGSIRRLKLLFPFWNMFYWISFWVVFFRRKDQP